MSLSKQKILGIGVTVNSKKEILEYIEKYLGKSAKKPLVIVTPNPEQIVAAQSDNHFRKLLNQADVAIPDGIGLARVLGCRKIAGIDFMKDLVGLAAKQGFPIALIGGRDGVAVKALECLSRQSAGLHGWVEEPGEVSLSHVSDLRYLRHLEEKIQKTGVRIVFVGLGAPKQEYFIERLASQDLLLRTQEQVLPLVLMSVGGSFDIFAGKIPRAPSLVRAVGLEWLWRLVLEPWRWRRQLSLLKFIWLICKSHLK